MLMPKKRRARSFYVGLMREIWDRIGVRFASTALVNNEKARLYGPRMKPLSNKGHLSANARIGHCEKA